MRPIAWLPVVTALVLLCVGCADPSLETEADELRDEVAGLPGVTSAKLRYTEPVTLDSGKLLVKVEMGGSATPEEIALVAETAYDAFSGTHHGEEADLSLRAGRTTVAIRSFEPDASVEAVGDAVRTGLAAAPRGASVAIDLTTQDVSRGDHVAGTYVLALPEGSTVSDVPRLLTAVAADQPENPLIGWGAAAADGSSLSYDRGFPPPELVSRWERVQTVGPRAAVRAFADGALFVKARVSTRYDVRDPADRRELDRVTRPQLRALGAGTWVYDLTGPRGRLLASIDRYICASTSEGAYDDELEAWVESELGGCPGG